MKRISGSSDPFLSSWQNTHDSAWVPPKTDRNMVPSGRTENCIKLPKQIRVLGVTRGWEMLDQATQAKTRRVREDPKVLSAHEQPLLNDLLSSYHLVNQSRPRSANPVVQGGRRRRSVRLQSLQPVGEEAAAAGAAAALEFRGSSSDGETVEVAQDALETIMAELKMVRKENKRLFEEVKQLKENKKEEEEKVDGATALDVDGAVGDHGRVTRAAAAAEAAEARTLDRRGRTAAGGQDVVATSRKYSSKMFFIASEEKEGPKYEIDEDF